MSAPAPRGGPAVLADGRTASSSGMPTVALAVSGVVWLTCTATFAVAPSAPAGVVAYLLICLSAATSVAWGVRRHRPGAARPWLLLAAAPVLGAAGMALRVLLVDAPGGLFRLLPDLVTIPGYVLLAAGLLGIVSVRRGASTGAAVDGGLMAVAGLLLSWSLLIRPLLADADLPLAVKVLNGLYPALSVLVLFMAALLAMAEVNRIASAWALGLAVVALLGGDLIYAISAAAGVPTLPLVAANIAYCACFGALGVAGLLPSMVTLVNPTRRRARGYGHGRFTAVAVALLVPAVVVAVRPPGTAWERAVVAGLLCLVAVLVLVRTATAVNSTVASERRLEEQARRDALTGLPNRFHLAQHLAAALERARAGGRGVAVLFMDLNQFKAVNDTWGHQTGDELLVVIGSRLSARVRREELVARVGGDEFVVVAEDVAGPDGAAALARRLLDVFDDRVELPATTLSVGTSIGIALTTPGGAVVTAEDLLRDADTAMYRAKAASGSTFEIFDESMRVELAERLSLENDLREALGRGEIELHYQPIVDLETGITKGFEALMRWTHPVRGAVRPDVFIPVAEDTGLITDLGRFAIEQAGARLREWSLEHGGTLSMSVNLSPRQMLDPELVPTVARVLDGLPLPPSSLVLEITETSLIEDDGGTAATIGALKALGVRLSADDFGTGYSSLAYLRRYPFDQVKVDRSFVAGLEAGGDDEVIVAAVLSMARALSLTTVAEGVETPYQRDRLRELGAHSGQGWLFARPMPAEQAREHLARARTPALRAA
jgi:diguanylate cyclase (GGDEF)-like protein